MHSAVPHKPCSQCLMTRVVTEPLKDKTLSLGWGPDLRRRLQEREERLGRTPQSLQGTPVFGHTPERMRPVGALGAPVWAGAASLWLEEEPFSRLSSLPEVRAACRAQGQDDFVSHPMPPARADLSEPKPGRGFPQCSSPRERD